ncbi:hypothetical protein [Natrarchaeobius chitinivorans]|uniref:hypothetical protein n=1 Tax=Natrarchaeobius chitinivorans TaxID=1679083 RepID=UPI000F536098|nr:hypothetical protein [Natrarchaeobius chitinivorans]
MNDDFTLDSADVERDSGVDWPSEWCDKRRVEVYVGSSINRIDLGDISKACGIDKDRVRNLVADLAEREPALVDDGEDAWRWEEDELRRQERERLAEMAEDELHDELQRIDREIAKWRDQFDADAPDELENAETSYDWRQNLYVRDLILDVLSEESS